MISPEQLRRYPHFAGLSDASLAEVSKISETSKLKAGMEVFKESGEFKAPARAYEIGADASHLLLLVSGEVDMVYRFPNGEEVTVGTVVAGDLLGISALIEPHKFTTSAIAKKDGEFIQIEAEPLRKLCSEDTALGYRLMSAVAKAAMTRLEETRVQLAGGAS